jgi:hypothetical protein
VPTRPSSERRSDCPACRTRLGQRVPESAAASGDSSLRIATTSGDASLVIDGEILEGGALRHLTQRNATQQKGDVL